MYQRKQYNVLLARIQEKRHFIQVIMGPRQVGKSTLMKQVVSAVNIPYVFYLADAVRTFNSNRGQK
jgi:Predicted ATPase (AAA+ superfamily)